MARLLALEWDEREARVAVATVRRGEAVVEQAFTVTLHPERPGQTPADIGGKLGAALSARGISGRLECLVAVGRSSIELRHLSLPPSPEDELPEMVRFQALREFNALGDDWPLDFLPISGSDIEPRGVLAAAIAPELVTQIDATLQAAGHKPQHLILRACAAAALLRRSRPSGTERVRLLVDVLTDEADLTVLENDIVVFLRTVRLPGEPGSAEQSRGLIAETRRTMVAAQNRLGGGRVEAVYLCGGEQAQKALAEQMQLDLNLPVQVFQPFGGVACERELQQNLPANPGHFTPLLGMLLDAATDTPHALDFLHPRRKPEPPNRRNQYVLAGTAAAGLLLVLFAWFWFAKSGLDAEIAQVRQQRADLTGELKKAEELDKRMSVLDGWLADDFVWLDELRDLSAKFPSSKEAMLKGLQISGKKKFGEMQLDGVVQNSDTLHRWGQAVRDPRHQAELKKENQGQGDKMYPWNFSSAVTVKK